MLSMSVFAYFSTNSTHIRQSLERLCHFWDPHSILNQKTSLLLFLLLHSWFLRAKTALKMPSMVVVPCFSNFSTQYGQLYPILMSFLESSFNFRWKKHLSCFFSRFILDFCEPNYQKQPIKCHKWAEHATSRRKKMGFWLFLGGPNTIYDIRGS